MESINEIMTTAVGYILEGAAASKTAEGAKEEVLGQFWDWIRPSFLKSVPTIENPQNISQTEQEVLNRLVELIQDDEKFLAHLQEQIEALQKAGIKEKGIVNGDIKRVKRIRIGDKEYSTNEVYHRKNIVNGNIEDADEFILGDGH